MSDFNFFYHLIVPFFLCVSEIFIIFLNWVGFYFYILEGMPDLPRVSLRVLFFFLPVFHFEFRLGLGNSLCVQKKQCPKRRKTNGYIVP